MFHFVTRTYLSCDCTILYRCAYYQCHYDHCIVYINMCVVNESIFLLISMLVLIDQGGVGGGDLYPLWPCEYQDSATATAGLRLH